VSERGRERLASVGETLVGLAGVLGLSLEEGSVARELDAELIDLLIEVREKAREARQYEIADRVRARLTELGVVLEDRRGGTTWRRR